MLLTDEALLNYKRCTRRAFLGVYGNPLQRDPEKDFLLLLRSESKNHLQNILEQFYPIYHEPTAPEYDWLSRAKETLALMRKGVECIYQGVLCQDLVGENGPTITLIGCPDLLIKQPGQSYWGSWTYLSVSVHLGRRPKPEYKLIAAFYAKILESIQGSLPSTSEIILRRHNRYSVNLAVWMGKLNEELSQCLQILLGKEEPEVFISRQRCSLCHWYTHCYTKAKSENHLSLVPGVTPNRYQQLQTIGVNTLESLATACPVNIGELLGSSVAVELKQQALSILENRPIIKSSAHIPINSIELYFDIEAEPERNLDYLLGVLLFERQTNKQIFYPFLAEKPEEEGEIWHQFLTIVNKYNNVPIFHYSEYEVETIQRLGKLYKSPAQEIDLLLSRLVDVHHLVINTVTLPVESYSLKSLANWLGFRWRDGEVSGEQAVCWYDSWLKTGDRSRLDAILRYNEDDCRATLYLKEWLVNFIS